MYAHLRNVMLCITVFLIIFLQACSSNISTKGISFKNVIALKPASAEDYPTVSRAEMAFTYPKSKDFPGSPSSKAFVGLALSGGGSRAANFTLATLQELDEMGVLEHVNAISSVSGGSLTGAYFALHSDNMNWIHTKELMRQDFISSWIARVFRPDNLIRQFATDFDRSDIMASIFDEKIFHGAKFSDLGNSGPRRPKIFINATNASSFINGNNKSVSFIFDDFGFRSELNSDLRSYPISSAVMASAAFPGVFNQVTLQKFNDGGFDQSNNILPPRPFNPPRYMHLMDGGPSDNLGLQTIIEAAFSHFLRSATDGPTRPTGPCLLILADAFQPIDSKDRPWKSDPRTFLDHFVDTDFFDAISVMFAQRREETLEKLGIKNPLEFADKPQEFTLLNVNGISSEVFTRTRRTGTLSIPYQCMGSTTDKRECNLLPRTFNISNPDHFTCKVWHLSLADVRNASLFNQDGSMNHANVQSDHLANSDVKTLKNKSTQPSNSWSARAEASSIIARIVERIPTHFKLKGPDKCSPLVIQAALYDAASLLARDPSSVVEICEWFHSNDLIDLERCLAPSVKGTAIHRFPIKANLFAPSDVNKIDTSQNDALSFECSGDETFLNSLR